MKKNLRNLGAIIFCYLFITGCPVYDPPSDIGMLEVQNNSDGAIYVHTACQDLITEYPEKHLYEIMHCHDCVDASGNKMNDTFYSPNRIGRKDKGQLHGFGKRKDRNTECNDSLLRIFFISEMTMRKNSWKEIAAKQLYLKKVVLTQKELDFAGWKIIYY